MKNIEDFEKLLDGRNRAIMQYGRNEMKKETLRAFSSGTDPGTGKRWAPRKESYPWPILRHSHQLYGTLAWGYGIKTKDKRLKFFGKVKDGFAKGAFTRGGGGVALGARKPYILVAGAVHYGRRRARSAAMWKPKEHGYLRTRGRMVFHGGGTKLHGTGPSTGKVPARPLFGFSRSARKSIKRYAEKRLARVFK